MAVFKTFKINIWCLHNFMTTIYNYEICQDSMQVKNLEKLLPSSLPSIFFHFFT